MVLHYPLNFLHLGDPIAVRVGPDEEHVPRVVLGPELGDGLPVLHAPTPDVIHQVGPVADHRHGLGDVVRVHAPDADTAVGAVAQPAVVAVDHVLPAGNVKGPLGRGAGQGFEVAHQVRTVVDALD